MLAAFVFSLVFSLLPNKATLVVPAAGGAHLHICSTSLLPASGLHLNLMPREAYDEFRVINPSCAAFTRLILVATKQAPMITISLGTALTLDA